MCVRLRRVSTARVKVRLPGRLTAVVIVALAASRCFATDHTSPAASLIPIARFVDDPAIARPADVPLDWGGYVTIGNVAQPVLSSARSIPARILAADALPVGTRGTSHARLPRALAAVEEVLVVPALTIAGVRQPFPAVRWRPARAGLTVDLGARLYVSDLKWVVSATAHALPELRRRDVETGPLPIPDDAVLTFALGIEEAAMSQGPVEFVASALDGDREVELHRQALDPANRADRDWRAVRVDLRPLAGKTVRFRFAARAAAGRQSLPVWGDPTVLVPRPAMHALNVVLVSLDTLRARSVGSYGSPRDTTPRMDAALGSDGTLFELAFATVPHTLPSHASLFTAVYPRSHGILGFMQGIRAEVPTLPEAFRAAGYETAAFTEDAYVIPEAGFRRGFGWYVENKSPGLQMPRGFVEETFGGGVAWMRAHRDRPFFLFLHTYQVHEPYTPPAGYATLFEDATFLSGALLELLRYEQEVRYTDDAVGALLDEMDAIGIGTRTLIVVLADHGEEFLEHGRLRHGYDVYEESTHVPLFVRLPGVVPAGLRVRAPVSLVDVAPTILDLAGLPLPAGVEGRSRVPLLHGGDDAETPPVLSIAGVEGRRGAVSVAVRTATDTCIFPPDPERPECYDPVIDPFEQTPLPVDPEPSWLAPLRAHAAAYRARTGLAVERVEPLEIDPEREQKLRALGYLE